MDIVDLSSNGIIAGLRMLVYTVLFSNSAQFDDAGYYSYRDPYNTGDFAIIISGKATDRQK